MPAVSGRAVFVPQPYALMQHLDDQISLGGVAQGLLTPGGSRLLLHPFTNLHCLHITAVSHTGAASLLRWQTWRIGQVDVSIRMDLGEERFSLCLQGFQQFQRGGYNRSSQHHEEGVA